MTAARVLMLLLMVLPAAAAAQDGRALFAQRCASCHATDPAAPELPGPNLAALIGRPVGGDAAFDYSPALRKARAAGIVWDAERLVRFLEDPDEMFPGLWMGANGLRDPGERAALAAWLGGGAR